MAWADNLNALTDSLSSWEIAGYVVVAAVAVGVSGEVIHDFFDWFKSVSWWRTKGNKASALLLVVALVSELVIQVKTNSISGRIIAFLEEEAAEERVRTAEIEKVAAWRNLEPTTQQKLLNALRAVPASVPHKVVLAYAQNDDEALYFTYLIGRLFLADKSWDVNLRSETHTGMLYWGVRILGPENETTRAIRDAFTSAGVAFSTDPVPGPSLSSGYMPKPSDTVILIGPKKPPFE